MPIDRHEVERIARLARIDLAPEAADRLREQLGDILDYVARLDELDPGDTSPTALAEQAPQALRADEPGPGLTPDEALSPAPDSEAGHFRVPRVLDTP